jgi:lipid II:glycine glycyltransferase (peptidoglycan interpeptide bridge formation enzyme)
MKVEILNKSQEKIWDEFVESHELGTLQQTSRWGHFQAKIPTRGKYWILALMDKEKIIGGTMLIYHGMANKASWLYCARGPLLDYNAKDFSEKMKIILERIKKIAKTENSVFVRIDPPLAEKDYQKWPRLNGFYTSHLGFQPEDTLMLDLTKSETEILAQMKPKGRYNIRLAEKHGVTIRESDPKDSKQFAKDITEYHKILHETTMRDKFYGHRKNVYTDMIRTLFPQTKLHLAEYQGHIIAGLIATYHKDIATYYYGASSDQFRNVMAPYLLQWQVAREAKSQGFKFYDFMGIAPTDDKNHPWAGVTEFKRKFGGIEMSYLPAKEYPFQKLLYLVYRFYKFIRK